MGGTSAMGKQCDMKPCEQPVVIDVLEDLTADSEKNYLFILFFWLMLSKLA